MNLLSHFSNEFFSIFTLYADNTIEELVINGHLYLRINDDFLKTKPKKPTTTHTHNNLNENNSFSK
jgi:hypothetical protein